MSWLFSTHMDDLSRSDNFFSSFSKAVAILKAYSFYCFKTCEADKNYRVFARGTGVYHSKTFLLHKDHWHSMYIDKHFAWLH